MGGPVGCAFVRRWWRTSPATGNALCIGQSWPRFYPCHLLNSRWGPAKPRGSHHWKCHLYQPCAQCRPTLTRLENTRKRNARVTVSVRAAAHDRRPTRVLNPSKSSRTSPNAHPYAASSVPYFSDGNDAAIASTIGNAIGGPRSAKAYFQR